MIYKDSSKTPFWPFRFGLSYNEFEFYDLRAEYIQNDEKLKLNITFKVKNTGNYDGDVVPMLFLHFPDSIKSDCDVNDYPEKL